MCFGGTPKIEAPPVPAVEPAPKVEPVPSPVAERSPEPTAIAAAEKRRKIAAIRAGVMSTIKTSPRGITGLAPDLTAIGDTGKKTLGS